MNLIFSDRIVQRFANGRTVVFLLLLAFSATSCKDEQLLGLELQPAGEFDPVQYTDTLTVRAFTMEGEAQRSDEAQSYLGKIQSPLFGASESALILNFAIEAGEFLSAPAAYHVDSVVLHLKPIYTYGQYGDPIPVEIYRLTQQVFSDSAYTSDFAPAIEISTVGNKTLHLSRELDVKDSILVEGTKEAFQFRIPIDDTVGTYLLEGMTAEYANTEALQNYFKGLYIRVAETMDPSLAGVIFGFDLTAGESRLRVYATKDDLSRTIVDYGITSKTTRVNQFKVKHEGSVVGDYITAGSSKQDLIFVQGMTGARAEVSIPYLDEFGLHNPAIAVNKATLTFNLSEQQPSGFPNSTRLFLLDLEEGEVESLTLDYIYSSDRHGGSFDSDSKSYTFDITRHVQKVLSEAQNGNDINRALRLHAQVPVINGNDVSQNVLKGSGNIVLKLFYTDLND